MSERKLTAREEMVEAALLQLQAEPDNEKYINGLQDLIGKARAEGHGFKLEVFAEVLDNSGPLSKAITKEDAGKHADNINADLITLRVPPEKDSTHKNKGARLFATTLREKPALIFETEESGAVGCFYPNEIDTLELE